MWDKSGINVTGSSVGHDVTLYIDDNPIRNYNLNDYYKNIPDKQGEGEVGFLYPNWNQDCIMRNLKFGML